MKLQYLPSRSRYRLTGSTNRFFLRSSTSPKSGLLLLDLTTSTLTPQREVTRDQAMTAAHFDREGRKVDSDRNAYVAEKSGN